MKPKPAPFSAVLRVRRVSVVPCRQAVAAWSLLLLLLLTACGGDEAAPQPTATPEVSPTAEAPSGVEATSEGRYRSSPAPSLARVDEAAASRVALDAQTFELASGDLSLRFGAEPLPDAIVVSRAGQPAALALRPLGAEANLLADLAAIEPLDEADGGATGVRLVGEGEWARWELRLWLYPFNPGLLHYRMDVAPKGALPRGGTGLEWQFVDPATGEETAANFEPFAERTPFAAPMLYGYSETLDATLLYWLDLTRLNPFIQATRYSPASTVLREGRTFGHELPAADLRELPAGEAITLYDGYLYLAPGQPADEDEMFRRYLHGVADIYDLLAKPDATLPDWRALADETLADLDDPETWVELNGKRYWRAYVADTRQSAEAITQLDVGLAAARYAARFDDAQAQKIADLAEATLEDFYNPQFGLVQNSGPLTITGNQGRGDTWYELGHVLKLAEWGLLGSQTAADLARRSAPAWMDYAHTVDYRFHRFYNFPDPNNPDAAWQGTEREPDAAGGYAYYMLLLHELTGDETFLDEAKAAAEAIPGNGFLLAYESHVTAQAAAALARLWTLTGDDRYLTMSYATIANLVRLSWIWEVDYGPAAPATTFWGLGPTQQSGVITPKEQYESWLYLDEYLRLTSGRLDPSVEKLVGEFLAYSLVTSASSLPPLAPEGTITLNPSAYPTVGQNRLDLFIPVEDVRDGWGTWGTIGQEVYGAGMAPTFAAMAGVER